MAGVGMIIAFSVAGVPVTPPSRTRGPAISRRVPA
jgi:hypothetical protein